MSKIPLVMQIGRELEHRAFMQVLEHLGVAQSWGVKTLRMSHDLGDDITTIDRRELADGLKEICIQQRKIVTALSQNVKDGEEEMVELLTKKAAEALTLWLKKIDDAFNNVRVEETADV